MTPAPKPNRPDAGVAMVAVVIVTMLVTMTVAAFLTLSRARVLEARIQPARSRAIYDALGELHQARLFVERGTYALGANQVLAGYAGKTIPGTEVEVVSMQSTGRDPQGIFYALRARGEHDGVRVHVRQLVEQRESMCRFLALVTGDGLSIAGVADPSYDPQTPRALPPAPLSAGRIHANGDVALAAGGWRHFLSPITTTEPDWTHVLGSQPGQQVFWHQEQTRTSVAAIAMPPAGELLRARNAIVATTTATVTFPDTWADGYVRANERGLLVSGPVDVSVTFAPDSFSLALREQTGSHRVTSLSSLAFPSGGGVIYVETGTLPVVTSSQTVHVQGKTRGRYTVIAAHGDVRVAGDLLYLDASNRPAALLDPGKRYIPNPAYDGDAAVGLVAEFDVRYGIRPTVTTWPATDKHVDATTGQWTTTPTPGLQGLPAGPRGETPSPQDGLFGFLGGPTGNDPAVVHAALLARTGRVYPDGLNPRPTALAYRAAKNGTTWTTPYARTNATLLRFGSVVSHRQPLDALAVPASATPVVVVGWGSSQVVYDEGLATNAPPYFPRHDRPAFHPVEIADVEEIR